MYTRYTAPYSGEVMNALFLCVPFLTCTEVMEPFLVVVIRSCMVPMSVARVG